MGVYGIVSSSWDNFYNIVTVNIPYILKRFKGPGHSPLMIRLKVRLTEQKNNEGSRKVDGKWVDCIKVSVVFIPVANDSPENKLFWDATPEGKIEFSSVNPGVLNELVMSREYYVDIMPAEEHLNLP